MAVLIKSVTQDISTATLKLRVKHLANGTPASAYLYSVNDDEWQEDILTWNTASAGDILLDSHSDISYTETVYSFDLSAFVRSELQGDKTVTVMLQDDDAVNMEVRFYNLEEYSTPKVKTKISKI